MSSKQCLIPHVGFPDHGETSRRFRGPKRPARSEPREQRNRPLSEFHFSIKGLAQVECNSHPKTKPARGNTLSRIWKRNSRIELSSGFRLNPAEESGAHRAARCVPRGADRASTSTGDGHSTNPSRYRKQDLHGQADPGVAPPRYHFRETALGTSRFRGFRVSGLRLGRATETERPQAPSFRAFLALGSASSDRATRTLA